MTNFTKTFLLCLFFLGLHRNVFIWTVIFQEFLFLTISFIILQSTSVKAWLLCLRFWFLSNENWSKMFYYKFHYKVLLTKMLMLKPNARLRLLMLLWFWSSSFMSTNNGDWSLSDIQTPVLWQLWYFYFSGMSESSVGAVKLKLSIQKYCSYWSRCCGYCSLKLLML